MVNNIDKKLAKFAADVKENGLQIGSKTFSDVQYVLAADLKAVNKVTGLIITIYITYNIYIVQYI